MRVPPQGQGQHEDRSEWNQVQDMPLNKALETGCQVILIQDSVVTAT